MPVVIKSLPGEHGIHIGTWATHFSGDIRRQNDELPFPKTINCSSVF